jgi:hypothetical protein
MTAPSDVLLLNLLLQKNEDLVEMYRHLLVVYGNKTLDVCFVNRWVLRVKWYVVGNAIIADQDQNGRPVTVRPINKSRWFSQEKSKD